MGPAALAVLLAVTATAPRVPGGLLPGTRAGGGRVLPAPAMDKDLGVTFELSTCFWDPPPSGLLPVRVDVRNDSRRSYEWTATFTASAGYHRYGTSYRSSHALAVPAGSSRRFDLLVPLHAGAPASGRANSLQVAFDGPGSPANPVSLFMNNYYLHSGAGHRAHTAWIGVSESLGAAHWETAKTLAGSRDSLLLVGSRFETACLPADWRSYVGFDALALTADEWRDLDAGARTGIERWVARGGRLWLAGGPALPQRLGFGEIEGLAPREGWTAATLADAVVHLRASAADDYSSWSLASEMAAPVFPKGLMLAFIAGFALLVGPVNLFAFCRRQNRHRIFWTTPLLSMGASLGLAALILLQDGTGGRGERAAVVGLLPERHEEVLLQEQLSRTGLLLRSRFQPSEPLWMEPIEGTPDTSGGPRGMQLARTGDVFSGDWFVSRALQAQRVEAVRSSRSRLELEEKPGEPPRLVSTVPDTLAEAYYIDADARYWRAENVEPGRGARLAPATEADFTLWWEKATAHHGPALEAATGRRSPGTIFAAARASTSPVATLGSIRWRDRGVLYVQRSR